MAVKKHYNFPDIPALAQLSENDIYIKNDAEKTEELRNIFLSDTPPTAAQVQELLNASTPIPALLYARDIIHGDVPGVADRIKNDSNAVLWYTQEVLNGARFPNDVNLPIALQDAKYIIPYIGIVGTPIAEFEKRILNPAEYNNETIAQNVRKYAEMLLSINAAPVTAEMEYAISQLSQVNLPEFTYEYIAKTILTNLRLMILADRANEPEKKAKARHALFSLYTNLEKISDINIKSKLQKYFESILNKYNAFEYVMGKTSATYSSGGKMHRTALVKAYVTYYMKTYLPKLLRQAKTDEQLPQIINTGVGEIKDLMYGDNVIVYHNDPTLDNQILKTMSENTGLVKSPKENIPGGAADNLTLQDIAKKWSTIYGVPEEELYVFAEQQLKVGEIVELEHTNNPAIAREIAMDHLTESLDYYSYLNDMEKLFPKENIVQKDLPEPEETNLAYLPRRHDPRNCPRHQMRYPEEQTVTITPEQVSQLFINPSEV